MERESTGEREAADGNALAATAGAPGAASACATASKFSSADAIAGACQADRRSLRRTAIYLAWVLLMAYFFANVEIQIEGTAGWAAALPTWRVERHWLLDIFWGGRAMTGYHAWVFSFMALVFFAPLAFNARATWRDAALALAGLMSFWIVEDFLWFVLNPSWGLARFAPEFVPWHKHWWLGAPQDYWVGLGGALLLLAWRHRAIGPGRGRARRVQP